MVTLPKDPERDRAGQVRLAVVLLLVAAGGLGYGGWKLHHGRSARSEETTPPPLPSRHYTYERFTYWWGKVPEVVLAHRHEPGGYSNIEPADYVGPEACRRCHEDKYRNWTRHSHHWMNARATPDHVRGDFSGQARFPYLGGEGRFWREGDKFRMAAERGNVKRVFRINRTIGSRYFQYYVGVQLEGPEPADDPRYRVDHVLPFGYWLTRRQWVPTVHLRDERAADFDDPALNPYESFYFTDYDRNCSQCHTTLPFGEWLVRDPAEAGHYTPHLFSLDLLGYLKHQRPECLPPAAAYASDADVRRCIMDLVENRPPARIAYLGIVCEACHNGGKAHAADPDHVPPYFFPASPLIYARLPARSPYGRTHDNVNWICARCHNGMRPLFPGGLSTWNSVEYTDAMRGSCYSQLRCVDCHDPHKPIGPAWPHSADHDDASCLKCHVNYRQADVRRQHTHHASGSEGDRCMNCHMPRLNEGMDQVVRTHTIFSPTRAAPLEQNGPNACNLCHLDRSINWTLGYLRDWYGRSYNEAEIARHYASRTQPLGEVWLRHPFHATRLVAASSYRRQKAKAPLPALLEILDDKYLLNRQFGQLAVEDVTGRSLETWGYRFTQSPTERAAVLPKLRAAISDQGSQPRRGAGF